MIYEFLKKKLFYLLFLASCLFMICSLPFSSSQSFVINIHDTYFVISSLDFYIIFCFFLLILGLLYWILEYFKITLISMISRIHILGTLLFLLLFLLMNYKASLVESSNKIQDVVSQPNYYTYSIVCLMLIISLQFLFIINIFVALIRKLRTLVTS